MVQKSGVHQLRLVVYRIIYRVFFYIPGGAGFLPSTVLTKRCGRFFLGKGGCKSNTSYFRHSTHHPRWLNWWLTLLSLTLLKAYRKTKRRSQNSLQIRLSSRLSAALCFMASSSSDHGQAEGFFDV